MSMLEDDVAARLMEWVDEEYAAAVEIATYPPTWSEDLMYERNEMMRRVEEAPLAYEVLLEWDMEEVVAADHELILASPVAEHADLLREAHDMGFSLSNMLSVSEVWDGVSRARDAGIPLRDIMIGYLD